MEEDLASLISLTEQKETSVFAKIIAVRHAESIANTEGKYQGHTYDTDLSPLGIQQAQALAKRLAKHRVRKIITSPLRRAYQTALEISRVVDCTIDVDLRIVETNHGVWEGKTKDWIKKNHPEIYKAWLNTPSSVVFPGGEAFVETLKRIESFLHQVELVDDTVLVTHDNVMRILVTLANGWSLDEIWRHEIEPAALNFFEINKVSGKNKLKVLKLNDNIHLKEVKSNLDLHAL